SGRAHRCHAANHARSGKTRGENRGSRDRVQAVSVARDVVEGQGTRATRARRGTHVPDERSLSNAALTAYRYRADVLEQLSRHGIQPSPSTRPEVVHEFISDLYR